MDQALTLLEAIKRAGAAYQVGQLDEAERLAQAILDVRADHFDALHLLAVVESRRRRHAEALTSYDRALAVRPDHPHALYNRGNTLRELKRFAEALASYDRALAVWPDYPEALNNRASTLQELKRFAEALASCDRALAVRPDFHEAHNNRGNVLKELKRFDEALASYERALALRPDAPGAHNNRASTLQQLKRFAEALASCDRALALQPDFPEALYNRGVALHELGRLDEALASYDRALAVRPDYAEALHGRGVSLQDLKRFDEALASYDRALVVRPDYAEAHWNESLVRLLTGDFARGWEKYEWRWKAESLNQSQRNFERPLWLGGEGIEGKTIVLYSEQGLGDTIQFCRYAPLVCARGARVLLQVPASLQNLMASLAGVAQVIGPTSKLPDFDLHCPLLSLPLAFRTTADNIPSATPYLNASDESVRSWSISLGLKSRPRIGLVWSGRPTPKDHHYSNRSVKLESLLQLLDFDATFVSLQKDIRPDDAIVLKDRSDLLHFGDKLKDFSDTAALISNLDLVISVDTSVAHLAGALAKPVWVLLTFVPDWRWLLDRDDNPWYPTARLFRQDATRAWDDVIARVHAALHDFVRQSRSTQ